VRPRDALGRAARLGIGLAAAGAAWAGPAGGALAAPLPVNLADLPQAPLLFTGQGVNESLGTPFGQPNTQRLDTCDLDGDGVDDLVASASGWTIGGINGGHHGRVHVIRGRAGWTGGTLPAAAETVAIAGYEEGQRFGEDIVCAGDVDGDGIDDLAIGMGGSGGPASGIYAYLVHGATDLFGAGSFSVDSAPGRVVAIDNVNVKAGAVPTEWAPLGDIDDDGYDDLALATGSAGIWVVPGRPRTAIADDTIDVTQPGSGYLAAVGVSYDAGPFDAVGDVDGDGVGDFALGEPAFDGAVENNGIVRVLSGTAFDDPDAGPFNVATEPPGEKVLFRIEGPAQHARAGMAIAALGDVDGDDRDDFAVGVPGSPYATPVGEEPQVGQVFVVHGRTSHDQIDLPGLGAAGGYAIAGLPGGAQFGSVVESAGDLDGDGNVDLLVGAPSHLNPALAPSAQYANGAAYVVYGQAGSETVDVAVPTAATGAVLLGQHHYANVGASFAVMPDLDGNGQAELVIGGHPRSAPGKGELTVLRLGEPLPDPPGPDPDPGPGPGPGPGPDQRPGPGPDQTPRPGPDTDTPTPDADRPKPKPVTGEITKTGRRGSVTVALSRRLGAKPRKTYRVRLARKGKVVATGTVRGKTLKLRVRKVGKGKRARYPKLNGAYALTGAKGVAGVTKTQVRIG
jgi:hypothetical protein